MRTEILLAVLLLPVFCARAAPLEADQPLPDVTTLLKQVERNQQRLEQDREKYTFTDVEKFDDVRRNGQVITKSVDQYDVFFLRGYLIRRLVKKDGKPLSVSAQKKEDGHVRKRIEKDERKAVKRSGADDQTVGIDVFLRTSRFDHPRWERRRGREVLAFDFQPIPDYHPRTLAEKIVHSLAGEIWVDAQAREVVSLQAWFDTSFKIGGGLVASLEKGTSVVAEQMLVDGDVWLPSYTSIHANGRVLLIKGVRVNVEDRYSDYRVFHVDSLSKIVEPKR